MTDGFHSPGFRQAGDPGVSAAVEAADIAAAIAPLSALIAANAVVIAANTALMATMPRKIAEAAAAARSSITVAFAANLYRRLTVALDWDGGGPSTVELTGLSAGTYDMSTIFQVFGGISGGTTVAQPSWSTSCSAGATSRGTGEMTLDLPPAPGKKTLRFTETDDFVGGACVERAFAGYSSDVTHDPTGLVITLDAARICSYTVWGWPS